MLAVVLRIHGHEAGQALAGLAVSQHERGELVAGHEVLDEGGLVKLALDPRHLPHQFVRAADDAAVVDAHRPRLAHRLHERGVLNSETSSELRTRWCDGTGTPRLASVSCVLNLSIMSFIVWLFEPT